MGEGKYACKIIQFFSDLHHSHVHTVFRAAQKVPNAPVLYDLWAGDSYSPELDNYVTPDYCVEDSLWETE